MCEFTEISVKFGVFFPQDVFLPPPPFGGCGLIAWVYEKEKPPTMIWFMDELGWK